MEKTKATPDVLSSFEENALVDHPMFNRVYLKSFVRMFAEVLEIDPDLAARATEQLLEGRYDGLLGREYLDRPTGESDQSSEETREEEDSDAAPAHPDPEPVAREEVADVEEVIQARDIADIPQDDAVEGAAPEPEKPKEGEPGEVEGTGPEPEEAPEPEGDEPEAAGEPESEAEVADLPEPEEPEIRPVPVATPEGMAPTPLPVGPPWMGRLLWAVPVVVVLALAGILLFGRAGEPEPVLVPPTEPTPVQPMPPARVDTTDTMRVEIPPRVVLGDTVDVWVIAARDTLNPVRITADDDLRRPYWVELGDSLLVRITDRIVLERETENLEVGIAGYAIPLGRFDTGTTIEMNREQLQETLDSLRMVQ